ncbi:MAG: glycosyltransferase family 4 protein [Suipraeoptans sp.]
MLVTASTFPRWENDTEPRFILDLCIAMSKYYDVTVLVPSCPGAKDEEIIEGIRVIRYHYFPLHKWETLCYPGAIVPRIKEKKVRAFLVPFLFFGLRKSLDKLVNNYEFVHSHWLIPQGIMQFKYDIPYILTGHGGDVSSLNFWPISILKAKAINGAKKFTVVSNDLRRIVMNINTNIRPMVISMGCDLKKFSPQNFKENFFNQGNLPVILFVGRLAEKKGVEYLIQATKNMNVRLVIVGDGPLREKLVEKAKKSQCNVDFLGAKSHMELPTIYASADVFVAPSIVAKDGDKEGLPTTIIEAMASGIPTIASRSGGISEIIEHGVNGFLCEEKNIQEIKYYIEKVISDKCSDIKKNALKTAMEYDYSNIALKYKNIIDN